MLDREEEEQRDPGKSLANLGAVPFFSPTIKLRGKSLLLPSRVLAVYIASLLFPVLQFSCLFSPLFSILFFLFAFFTGIHPFKSIYGYSFLPPFLSVVVSLFPDRDSLVMPFWNKRRLVNRAFFESFFHPRTEGVLNWILF